MRSKQFFAMALVGSGLGALGLLGGGCGGNSGTGTGATGGSSSSSGGSTSSTSSSAVTTGSGGGTPTGINSFATAAPITVGASAPTMGTLVDAMTPDYYSFTGTKGERIVIEALAQQLTGSTDLFDQTVTDTVVTLYLPDMKTQWAQDDDWWPRYTTDSRLFVELPMDGTYYFTVEDCNAAFPSGCAMSTGVSTFTYEVAIGDVKETKLSTPTAMSSALTYTQATGTGVKTGEYDEQILGGDFTATASPYDVQTFVWTAPTNTYVDPAARTRAYFYLQPIGTNDGDGSLAKVTLVAKDKNGTIVAQADQQNYDNGDDPTNGPLALSFPLFDATGASTLGQQYTVEVHNEGLSNDPTKNYYFISHSIGSQNYGTPETETPGQNTDDTSATAQALTSPTGLTGDFFVDGNISQSGDVDWYSVVAPAGTKSAFLSCESARAGSGLLGFTATLYAADGTTVLDKRGPESSPAKVDLLPPTNGVTATAATYLLQVSGTGQSSSSPPNTGTYYSCSVTFSNM